MSSTVAAIAALYLALALAVLAKRKSGYSHVGATISELGEVGAPDQKIIAWGVFFPVGILAALSGLLLYRHSQVGALLGFSIAVGYIVTALFPCDAGPPVVGSTRQGIHNLALAARYLGGGAALMSIEAAHAQLFKIAATVSFATVFLLMLAPASRVRGLTQRMAEIALFGGLVAVGHLFGR